MEGAVYYYYFHHHPVLSSFVHVIRCYFEKRSPVGLNPGNAEATPSSPMFTCTFFQKTSTKKNYLFGEAIIKDNLISSKLIYNIPGKLTLYSV